MSPLLLILIRSGCLPIPTEIVSLDKHREALMPTLRRIYELNELTGGVPRSSQCTLECCTGGLQLPAALGFVGQAIQV